MMEALSNADAIQGLQIKDRKLAGLGFADDALMFVKATSQNIASCLTLLTLFGDASDLVLNLSKSTLINVSAVAFHSLLWPGKRVDRGTLFRYLGYPLGVLTPTKQAIDWVFHKVKDKIAYWHSSKWPLHVCLQIIQAIMI